MDCKAAREALSARLDDEDPHAARTELELHLARCADCGCWREEAHEVTRRVRLAPARRVPGAPPWLIALATGAPAARRAARDLLWTRLALSAVGTAQLVWVAIPALLMGTDHDAPIHVSHEMGSFDLAVAVGLLLAAWAPVRAQGMRVVVGVAALLLMATAVIDIAAGRTTIADEAPHLLVVAGWLLLDHLARLASPGGGEHSFATSPRLQRSSLERRGAALVEEVPGHDALSGAGRARENVAA